MKIELGSTDAEDFLASLGQMAADDLTANARSCIETNVQYFRDYYSERNLPDPYEHNVIFAVDKDRGGATVAFRYFLMSKGDPWCRLFATYVAEGYRRARIGECLILKSIETAAAAGFSKFEVRLSEPESAEKQGLFAWYSRYADANIRRFAFRIFYTGKKFRP